MIAHLAVILVPRNPYRSFVDYLHMREARYKIITTASTRCVL